MYQQDATLIWSIFLSKTPEPQISTILGQHSIHQFFKTIPELFFEVKSYDCQTIAVPDANNITILVVSGNAYPIDSNPIIPQYPFHSAFHIQMKEESKSAAICYQTMHFLNSPA